MNNKVLCAIIAVVLLTACAGNKNDKSNSTDTTAVTVDSTVSTQKEELVTIPPIPESGIPEIPDAEVLYSDTEVVVVIDPEGTTYANGKPVPSDDAANIIVNQHSSKNTGTTTTKIPQQITTTTAPNYEIETDFTIIVPETEETLPEGTYYIDDTEDKEDNKNQDKNDNMLELIDLAKYVNTGKTDLAITDIKVFSNSKPGVSGLDAFKPGDTLIVNLWCDPIACLESVLYIVPMEAEHKDSYADGDYLMKYDMYKAFTAGNNQMVFEIELPKNVPAHIYEFRFVCGTEEGYIPFHIG